MFNLLDDAHTMKTMFDSGNASTNTTISRHQVECNSVVFNASTINYIIEERICYLYIMLPIALVGIILNIVTIRIFNEKSFNTVAFKYLRFMTCVDLLICFLLGAYSLLCHTTAYNSVDQYVRHIYLVFVYIPFANIGTNLTMLLTVLVTIERLVAIKWPTRKHKLFNTSRYYMSCALVLIIAIVFNIVYFFLYRIECTSTSIEPMANNFTLWTSWIIYGYIKEMLMRIVPITFLVIANIDLILTVKLSRAKMAKNKNKQADKQTMNAADKKRSRQDSQLTVMTVIVAFTYSICSVPMIFAYPGLVFKSQDLYSTTYKVYAAAVNILALSQSAFRFLIYFCFTTKFRHIFKKKFCCGTNAIPATTAITRMSIATDNNMTTTKEKQELIGPRPPKIGYNKSTTSLDFI